MNQTLSAPRPRFDGDTLILARWQFKWTDAKVPHRRNVLATCKSDRSEVFICSNYKHSLFWIHAIGDGFAGERSRHTNTIATRSRELAATWRAAVQAGKVRIEDCE